MTTGRINQVTTIKWIKTTTRPFYFCVPYINFRRTWCMHHVSIRPRVYSLTSPLRRVGSVSYDNFKMKFAHLLLQQWVRLLFHRTKANNTFSESLSRLLFLIKRKTNKIETSANFSRLSWTCS